MAAALPSQGRVSDAPFVKRWSNALTGLDDAEVARKLRNDCAIAHTLNTSFWVPATEGWQPRCALECLAVEVFKCHSKDLTFQRSTSGAEWWTQVTDANKPIELHWDKDEELFEASGDLVHPAVSTVTYLCGFGAPTLVLDKADASNGSVMKAALSWPTPKAHLRFRGNLLHGAVPLPATANNLSNAPGDRKGLDAYRVTFLVNIWLDYRPAACKMFPKRLVRTLKTGPGIHFDLSAGQEETADEPQLACRGELSGLQKTEGGNPTCSLLETSFGRFFGGQGAKAEVLKEHTLSMPLPVASDDHSSSSGYQLLHFNSSAPAVLGPYLRDSSAPTAPDSHGSSRATTQHDVGVVSNLLDEPVQKKQRVGEALNPGQAAVEVEMPTQKDREPVQQLAEEDVRRQAFAILAPAVADGRLQQALLTEPPLSAAETLTEEDVRRQAFAILAPACADGRLEQALRTEPASSTAEALAEEDVRKQAFAILAPACADGRLEQALRTEPALSAAEALTEDDARKQVFAVLATGCANGKLEQALRTELPLPTAGNDGNSSELTSEPLQPLQQV